MDTAARLNVPKKRWQGGSSDKAASGSGASLALISWLISFACWNYHVAAVP